MKRTTLWRIRPLAKLNFNAPVGLRFSWAGLVNLPVYSQPLGIPLVMCAIVSLAMFTTAISGRQCG
ncbi:MAG: hypothetical protein ABR514_10205 [Chthoniobacterales bacterium]